MNIASHIFGLLALAMALVTCFPFLLFDPVLVVVACFAGVIFGCLSTIGRRRYIYAYIALPLILIGVYLAMHTTRNTGLMAPTVNSMLVYFSVLMIPVVPAALLLWWLHSR